MTSEKIYFKEKTKRALLQFNTSHSGRIGSGTIRKLVGGTVIYPKRCATVTVVKCGCKVLTMTQGLSTNTRHVILLVSFSSNTIPVKYIETCTWLIKIIFCNVTNVLLLLVIVVKLFVLQADVLV